MRKAILTICLAVAMFSIVGCDSKPTGFDHRDEGWELWKEGEIVRKKINIENQTSSSANRIFVLEFKDGTDVKSSRFHEFEKVKENEIGKLYCWDGQDCDNTYMWIKDGLAVYDISPKKKEDVLLKTTPKKAQETYIRITSDSLTADGNKLSVKIYSWQGLMSPPPAYKTVLVKFKSGLVTTAHITSTGDWKSEMDRKKLSGGIALKKVSQWKYVDLE